MKMFKTLIFITSFLIIAGSAKAQFDKPVFQFSAGITNPDKQLRGNDYLTYTNTYLYQNPGDTAWYQLYSPTPFAFIDSSLIAKNFAAQTGFYFNGTAKINVDKYETFRLFGSVSFSSFNSFQTSKTGYVPVLTYSGAFAQPISYDYNFSNFGIGLGMELAPLSFTKLISPFVNGSVSFNFMNAKLSRTTNINDSTNVSFNGFRIGINVGAGIEFKVSPQWGFLLGAKYDFGNLLLKSADNAGLVEWGRTNASLNDDEGYYTSNIYGALGDRYRANMHSSKKDLDWATFYIGVNFYPNMKPTTPPKK